MLMEPKDGILGGQEESGGEEAEEDVAEEEDEEDDDDDESGGEDGGEESDDDEDDDEDEPTGVPSKGKSLAFGEQVCGLDLHPSQNVIAVGLITGKVVIRSFIEDGTFPPPTTSSSTSPTIFHECLHHAQACRVVTFSSDGAWLFTGSKDKSISMIDVGSGQVVWRQREAHSGAVNALHVLSPTLLASGDDDGVVKIWDTREEERRGAGRGALMECKEHTDFISGLASTGGGEGGGGGEKHLLYAISGDTGMSVYDVKRKKLVERSEDQEDELLSLCVMKGGRKVVCGAQNGLLVIFSAGTWRDPTDRFPGHPQSIDSMLQLDENTLLSGSSDGFIRVVSVHPNQLLGCLGDHEGFPVETMRMNHDETLIATASHDDKVRLWDSSLLNDEDDDEDEDEEEGEEKKGNDGGGEGKAASGATAEHDSDEEGEHESKGKGNGKKRKRSGSDKDEGDDDADDDDDDEEEEEEEEEGGKRKTKGANKDSDDDSDDSDDDDSDAGNGNRPSRAKMATPSEKFFADL